MQTVQRRVFEGEISSSRLGEDVCEQSAGRVSEVMKQDVTEGDKPDVTGDKQDVTEGDKKNVTESDK